MNTRIFFILSLVVCLSRSAAWSQDVPPPPPMPTVGPALSPPDGSPGAVSPAAPYQSAPYQTPPPQPGPYPQAPYQPPPSYPPGAYASPGAVMVTPAQPYPYAYPPPSPYVVAPAPVMVVAPPLASYQWTAAVDALFLERSSGGSIPLGFTAYNPGSNLPPNLPTDALYSDDKYFPLEAGVRLEVGRKFNENLTLEGTYWGLQNWSVSRTIYGDNAQDTVLAYSPYLQLPALLQGLNDSLGYTYSSQIENVEINTLFRINPADPYWEVNWLLGARYVYFTDHLALSGIDDAYSASEQLNYNTTNNLIGGQTGLLIVHGWSRYQWEAGLKCGLMANVYHQHGTDAASEPTGTPAGFTPYDITNSGCGLSALFEASIAARYRITENLWLRLGYQVYDVTGLALAPRQLGSFGHGGNVAFDGLNIGMQSTW